MKKSVLLSAAAFLNVLVILAYAQDVELEKIVITPYRTAISSGASGSSVENIDAGEMREKGVNSLKDALNESSSISQASSGSLGGNTSIFLRGHNSNHTRFMLEGIKVYDPVMTSAYYNFAHFDLQGIDRVEISKGPQSSLYGSDAIGGVISLFTKKGQRKPKLTFSQKAGSYNTYVESLDFSGKSGNLGYYAGLTRADIGGYSLAKEKNNNHERDPYHNLNSFLRLDYDVCDKTSLALLGHYIYAKYEYDGSSWTPPYLPADDDDNYAYDYEAIFGLIAKHQITDVLDYKLILSNTSIHRKGWEDASSDNWYTGATYQTDNQFELKLADSYKMIFGFDYLKEKGDSYRVDSGFVSDFPKETAYSRGYFIENMFSPNEKSLLSFSYRLDDHSSFKDKKTYRILGNYSVEAIKTKLKASYGTGFKAPSLYQLYAPTTAYGPIGNSNLKPEESESYELGFENSIFDKAAFSANYFQSQLKNLIDFSYASGYINIGKSRIKGAELECMYILNKHLNMGVGYTWLHTENKDNHAELARRPSKKVTFKLKYEFAKLISYLDFSYVGHRYSDNDGIQLLKSYILGNLSVHYKLKEDLSIFTRFENILNEKYEEITGYQTPKFSAYAGFQYDF